MSRGKLFGSFLFNNIKDGDTVNKAKFQKFLLDLIGIDINDNNERTVLAKKKIAALFNIYSSTNEDFLTEKEFLNFAYSLYKFIELGKIDSYLSNDDFYSNV